jgi:hypothetical protein
MLDVDVSIIDKTANLLSFMDLPVLSIVRPRSQSLAAAAQLRFTLLVMDVAAVAASEE